MANYLDVSGAREAQQGEEGKLRDVIAFWNGAPAGMSRAFYEGRYGRSTGLLISECSVYAINAPEREEWVAGWTEKRRQHDLANDRARLAQKAREDHDMAYSGVADILATLGIDPYQLREYLDGLPGEG